MALSACYSAKTTNDKNRYLQVSLLGLDKSTPSAMPMALFTAEVPLRESLPELPRELLRGRKREKSNIMTAQGNLTNIGQGNVVLTEKSITLSLGDDNVFDLGKLKGAPYKSILKAMLTGETFKASPTDPSGVKVVGVAGNVVSTSGTCPSFVYGKKWKNFFSKMTETLVPYGEGKTLGNTFLESASFTQLIVIIEVKTIDGAGNVSVVRSFGAGGDISDVSADDYNKFSCKFDIYSDGEEYSEFLLNGGINESEYDDLDIRALTVKTAITLATIAAPTISADVVTGDLALVIKSGTGAGACTIYRYTGTVWEAITGTCGAGTLIFSTKASTDGASLGTGKIRYYAYDTVSSASVGTLVPTNVTAISEVATTYGTTFDLPIMEFVHGTQTFTEYD